MGLLRDILNGGSPNGPLATSIDFANAKSFYGDLYGAIGTHVETFALTPCARKTCGTDSKVYRYHRS